MAERRACILAWGQPARGGSRLAQAVRPTRKGLWNAYPYETEGVGTGYAAAIVPTGDLAALVEKISEHPARHYGALKRGILKAFGPELRAPQLSAETPPGRAARVGAGRRTLTGIPEPVNDNGTLYGIN